MHALRKVTTIKVSFNRTFYSPS